MAAIRFLIIKRTDKYKMRVTKRGFPHTWYAANYRGPNFELGVWHANIGPWTCRMVLIQTFKLEWSSVIEPHIVKYFTAKQKHNAHYTFFLPWLLDTNIPLSLAHFFFFFLNKRNLHAKYIYVNRKLSKGSNASTVTYLHRDLWKSWKGEVNSRRRLLPPWHLLVCARQSRPCHVFTF